MANTITSDAREIKASVLHGAKDLRIEIRPLSAPSPEELQVAITHTGLCGSDLHYYRHFRNGSILVQEPLSLGHESAGRVVGIGSEVTGFEIGDRVALEVGLPCEVCEQCKEGRYNICKSMRFRSSAKAFPHAQGTLQERINHPAKWCHKLPQAVSSSRAALIEPLSVAIHASRRATLPKNSTILVFGAGAVGLLVAAIAKINGAGTVVTADIDAGRVDFAVTNSFAHRGVTIPIRRAEDIKTQLDIATDVASIIRRDAQVGEFDAVFECTGQMSCLQAAIYATRPGGKILLIGMGNPIQTLPISDAALREVDLIGVFRYADTYPAGIEVMAKKGGTPEYPDFDKLITHRFQGLQDVEKAFEMAARTVDEEGRLVIKVVVEMGE